MRAQGIDSREAGRLAHVAFGGVEKYKADARDSRGLQWIDNLALDARLGDPDARQVSGADARRRLRDGGGHRRGRDGLRSHHGNPRPRAPVRAGRPRRLAAVRDLDPGKPRAQGPARLRRLARGDQVGGAVGRIPQRPAQPRIGAAAARADQGCGDHGIGLHRRAHAAACRPVPAACRRTRERATGRGDWLSGVAVALRRRRANRGPHDQPGWDSAHRRRHHAGRVQVSGRSPVLDSAAREPGAVRTTAGTRAVPVRTPGARRHVTRRRRRS